MLNAGKSEAKKNDASEGNAGSTGQLNVTENLKSLVNMGKKVTSPKGPLLETPLCFLQNPIQIGDTKPKSKVMQVQQKCMQLPLKLQQPSKQQKQPSKQQKQPSKQQKQPLKQQQPMKKQQQSMKKQQQQSMKKQQQQLPISKLQQQQQEQQPQQQEQQPQQQEQQPQQQHQQLVQEQVQQEQQQYIQHQQQPLLQQPLLQQPLLQQPLLQQPLLQQPLLQQPLLQQPQQQPQQQQQKPQQQQPQQQRQANPTENEPQNAKSESKKHRQAGPLPGAPNQWYTLSNQVHKDGTTIEMMYTGQMVPQPAEPPLDLHAIPGVTHLTMNLPPGVMTSTKHSTPDMPSMINALDFFRRPESHQAAPDVGPSTSIQLIPKDDSNNINTENAETIEVIPLGAVRAAPLKRSAINVDFQSYSLMRMEVDEEKSNEPGRMVMDAHVSPTYKLTAHQQQRLQAAIMQEDVPIADALMPIINDLYEEQDRLKKAGACEQPAPATPAYGTMRFHYVDPPLFGCPKGMPSAPPCGMDVPRAQPAASKRSSTTQFRSTSNVVVGSTIMALDKNGNYRTMGLEDWSKLKIQGHQQK